MTSEHDKMRMTLDRLQAQLDELREVDPAVAARLQENIDQAKEVLAGRVAPPHEHGSVVDQLRDAVLELEASHPTLALNLGGLVDALGRMGI